MGAADGVYVGGITVNGELACPVTPNPICVAAGTSCLDRVIESDIHDLLDGSHDAL